MLLACPTEKDMKEWIRALKLHMIDMFEARSKLLEKKLERDGIRVPRGTEIIARGDEAKNIRLLDPTGGNDFDERMDALGNDEEEEKS